ncbi:hypothetical protein CPB83DRAFT_899940 [Crepidotus variabilis]|uniref:Uncharacterized protein n=1 Tax=Crepidotus variabilis TaxID=179855 RepID=A0A9P6E431_9AGAR|nr:hypothetical protein CPB83DRAFT_899940 [Crepidotus variabilis]
MPPFLLDSRRSEALVLDLAPSHLTLLQIGVAQVQNQFSSSTDLDYHIAKIIAHMTSIPATGATLKLSNDILDILEQPKFRIDAEWMVSLPLRKISSRYTSISISSQNEPSHAELLCNRLLSCEERHLQSNDLTNSKAIPNPFTSTISRLLHYIYINRIAVATTYFSLTRIITRMR